MLRDFRYISEYDIRYVSSDNEKLIRNYRNRKSLNKKHQKLRAQIAKLIQEEKQLEHECQEFLGLTHIINGVALKCQEGGRSFEVIPIERANERWARVYLNAHNETTYGIELRNRRGERSEHAWLGCNFKSYKKCKEIAIDWVTKGIEPPGDYRWW